MLLGCGCGGVLELFFVALAGGATTATVITGLKAWLARLFK
jgi:hypothetical protein